MLGRLFRFFCPFLLLIGLATAGRAGAGFFQTERSGGPTLGAPTPGVATPGASTDGEWRVTSIKGKFLTIDSSAVRVYLHLTAEQPGGNPVSPTDFGGRFLVNYVVYPDYNNRERLAYGNVPVTAQNVVRQGDHLMLTFDLKRPDRKDVTNALLLTEITETSSGRKALNDLPIRFRTDKITDRYALFDASGQWPQLRHYVTANDTVVIRDVAGTQRPLYLFRYRHEFDPASSPMNTAARPAPKSLDVDTAYTITTNQPLRLPAEGLYFLLDDTTATFGLGVVVADKRFPRLTRPEKLIKPVMYMSTGTEIGELNSAPDPKKALDRYWLGLMSGNEDIARRTIRTYYDRVADANRLFTTYKEGWKTDKGMIYIILGAPDRVQRSRDREVWVYNRRGQMAEANFTFNRKPNQFVEDHYELVRYMEYQPIWYPMVEAWRTGAIRE